MRRTVLALLMVSLAACSDDDSSSASSTSSSTTTTTTSSSAPGSTDEVVVDMVGFAFAPREVEVQVGQPVVWSNGDDFIHTAEGDEGEFDTGAVQAGATSAPVTFDEPGTYSYFCGIHNSMTGTVSVVG